MVTRFEDLIAWQKARELRKSVYDASRQDSFERDFVLRDQIRSSALSVMSNIAEGFERDGIAQFLYFLKIARASCNEVRSHLYAALDEGYVARQSCIRCWNERTRSAESFAVSSASYAPGTRH